MGWQRWLWLAGGVCWALGLALGTPAAAQTAARSERTEECLTCHAEVTPGIVADWRRSRHSSITPRQGRAVKDLAQKVSSEAIAQERLDVGVGCAECHLTDPEKHADSFDHNGYQVHTVVTPADCAVCHKDEAAQYRLNLMSHAYGNLMNNSLYRQLMGSINDVQRLHQGHLAGTAADDLTRADSCLACHGTKVEVTGIVSRNTDFGAMDFPQLTGWPNNGAGRINPDGSEGSCAACHTRHQFSIEMARGPDTCGQCHSGPDVPAFKVYKASKHGNGHASLKGDWNFQPVPWVVGRDFTAPTCAACHISLITDDQGSVLARRSHQLSDRLPWRIFGLIYAHPQPKQPDTSSLKNAAGLPLPTDLNGSIATTGLIDREEQDRRRATMQGVCLGCHSRQWVDGHWQRFEHAIAGADAMTRTATEIMQQIWSLDLVKGPPQQANPFDDEVEKIWAEQWLFYANSVRYSSAMMGADYGVFDNGRWYQSKNVRELKSWLDLRHRSKGSNAAARR